MTEPTAAGAPGAPAAPDDAPLEVDFHFDVMCPWAYQTSKWIREAAPRRNLAVRWRFFSLEEVNRQEGKKHPWEREWSYGWSMLRVAALLRRRPDPLGNAAVDRFYQITGRLLHEEGVKVHSRDGVAAALEEMGEEPAVVDRAVADPTTHEDVRRDHQRVIDLGGYGVPTLVIGSTPLFGPVVTPAPVGEEAAQLWDLVAGWTRFPHLYELRRPKTAADWEHIQSSFTPYLHARDWQTVQNPVA
ncbi:MAG: DsbA family protein [Acidobacteriota bacterium]|nr:DsbA family protein [Acidobacteriota bacterium]